MAWRLGPIYMHLSLSWDLTLARIGTKRATATVYSTTLVSVHQNCLTVSHTLNGLNHRKLLWRFWRLDIHSKCVSGFISPEVTFLLSMEDAAFYYRHVVFPFHVNVLTPSSKEANSHLGLGSTHLPLFYINVSLKCLSPYGPILRSQGWGFSMWTWEE